MGAFINGDNTPTRSRSHLKRRRSEEENHLRRCTDPRPGLYLCHSLRSANYAFPQTKFKDKKNTNSQFANNHVIIVTPSQ